MPLIKSALVTCCMFLCSFVFAQNENLLKYDSLYVYRGLKFGSDYDSIVKFMSVIVDDDSSLTLTDKKYLTFAGYSFENCYLQFINKKLAYVSLVSQYKEFADLKEYLMKVFDKPNQSDKPDLAMWTGKRLSIMLLSMKGAVGVAITTKEYLIQYYKPPSIDDL